MTTVDEPVVRPSSADAQRNRERRRAERKRDQMARASIPPEEVQT
jgi:hypothetical protein